MKKQELESFICSTLNLNSITPTIKKQITKFIIERGLKYEDIARALTFYIEIEKKEYEPRFGIAFVDWTVDKAKEYYTAIELKKQAQLESIKNTQEESNIILKIQDIKKRKPISSIDITKLGDE